MNTHDKAILTGKILIIATWVVLVSLVAAVSAEYLIAESRAAKKEARTHMSRKPQLQALERAYDPFTTQHLHPIYLFFFPFDRDERIAINNDVASIDAQGFRGASLADRGDRKLAFLLGGSAAFGHFSSSNETTITGYLNSLQDEYWFLNAGVPSWNSTQELFRLIHQVIELDPALIIAFDGANDATITYKYWQDGIDLPPGAAESFEKLSDLVDDIRTETPAYDTRPTWYERRFPELSRKLRKGFRSKDEAPKSSAEPLDARLQRAAEKYVLNLKLMQQLSTANGADFMGILQPIRSLHENIPDDSKDPDKVGYFGAFRGHVLGELSGPDDSLAFHDFSRIFDGEFDSVPVYDEFGLGDIDDETIFVDSVHLADRGNEIVARRILALLDAEGSRRIGAY